MMAPSAKVRGAAVLMAALTVCAAGLEIHLVTELERLTQQTETALRTPSTDVQHLRSLVASALDGAQGMTRAAGAAMLLAIGACAIAAVVLFAVARELKQRESTDAGDGGADGGARGSEPR